MRTSDYQWVTVCAAYRRALMRTPQRIDAWHSVRQLADTAKALSYDADAQRDYTLISAMAQTHARELAYQPITEGVDA